jgi:primosomal protein N'
VSQQQIDAVDAVGNVHWTVTRSINNLFVGRDDLLNTIEESIRHTLQDVNATGQQRFVITGMGGQGKSEICLQLANRVRPL